MRALLMWLSAFLNIAGPALGGSIFITHQLDPAPASVQTHFTGGLCPVPNAAQIVRWTFGDGHFGEDVVNRRETSSTISHTFIYPGVYVVKATISDTGEGGWTGQKSVTVNASISITPAVGVAGHPMTVTAVFVPPPRNEMQLSSVLGDGSTRLNTVPAGTTFLLLEHRYVLPGDYQLTIEGADLTTGAGWFGEGVVHIRGAIVVTPVEGIAEQWMNITATISPPAPLDMQVHWDLGDGSTWSNTVPAGTNSYTLGHRYVLPGVYRLYVTAEDPTTHNNWYGSADVTITSPGTSVFIRDFNVGASETGVEIIWDIYSDDNLKGYMIFRRAGTNGPEINIHPDRFISADKNAFLDDTADGGKTYTYTMGIIRADDSMVRSQPITIVTEEFTFSLEQNRPNPFNPVTTLAYSIPDACHVTLGVYDVHGRLVKTLVNGTIPGGAHAIEWDGRDTGDTAVASGVYLIRLVAGKRTTTKKIVLMK